MEKLDASEKLRRTYFAIGFAITQWQHVEMALTQLFAVLLSAEGGTAGAAFNSVLSFRTRLAMVKAAAAVRLSGNVIGSECIKLCVRLEGKAKKRNELAHFMLYQVPAHVNEGEEITVEELNRQIDWYLSPAGFDAAREWRYKNNVPKLNTNDIMNRARSFIEVSSEISKLSEKVRETLAPPSTHA
jgi:hypothetical protein